jgi:hypothetical protein
VLSGRELGHAKRDHNDADDQRWGSLGYRPHDHADRAERDRHL